MKLILAFLTIILCSLNAFGQGAQYRPTPFANGFVQTVTSTGTAQTYLGIGSATNTALAGGTVTGQTNLDLTASRVMVSSANKVPASSSVTATTLAFLDATSSVQAQLDSKPTVGLTNLLQLNADNTITGTNLVVQSTNPVFSLSDTDGTANRRIFRIRMEAGYAVFQQVSDSGAAADLLVIALDNNGPITSKVAHHFPAGIGSVQANITMPGDYGIQYDGNHYYRPYSSGSSGAVIATSTDPLVLKQNSNNAEVARFTGGALQLANRTNDPSTVANSAFIYNKSGEMYVMDGSGNVTLISPHAKDSPGKSVDAGDATPIVIKHSNQYTGRTEWLHLSALAAEVQRLSGKQFIWSTNAPPERRRSWASDRRRDADDEFASAVRDWRASGRVGEQPTRDKFKELPAPDFAR